MTQEHQCEEDIPDDYIPFRRLEIRGNVLENVRFLYEFEREHPFLIGRGNPYPKIWLSALVDIDFVRVVDGDRILNKAVTGETRIVQSTVEDNPEYQIELFVRGTRVLSARSISDDTVVIDELDLRPLKQIVYCEGDALYIDDDKFEACHIQNIRAAWKCIPDIIAFEGPEPKTGRPPMPASVQLLLRKEAGFGCCGCGHPIIEYHHIVPWEEVKHFDPEHMMAVCPNCHSKMTVMSRDDQYELKHAPYNIKRGFLEGQLVAPRKNAPAVALGNSLLFQECRGPIIIIDKVPILGVQFDDVGRPYIWLNLFDQNDKLIAAIRRNNWIAPTSASWDFHCREGYMKIRNKPNSILLEFNLKDDVMSFKGMFWKNGYNVWAKPSKLLMRKGDDTIVSLASGMFVQTPGLSIGRHGDGWGFTIA